MMIYSVICLCVSGICFFVAYLLECYEHYKTKVEWLRNLNDHGKTLDHFIAYVEHANIIRRRKNFYHRKCKKLIQTNNKLLDLLERAVNTVESLDKLCKIQVKDIKVLNTKVTVYNRLYKRYSDAFNMICEIGCDYDGYETVEGLKKTIDRIYDISEARKAEDTI